MLALRNPFAPKFGRISLLRTWGGCGLCPLTVLPQLQSLQGHARPVSEADVKDHE